MVYKWYILPIGGVYATYHLLREPETTIELLASCCNNHPQKNTNICRPSKMMLGRWTIYFPFVYGVLVRFLGEKSFISVGYVPPPRKTNGLDTSQIPKGWNLKFTFQTPWFLGSMLVFRWVMLYMGVSKNRGTPKSSTLIGFSMK